MSDEQPEPGLQLQKRAPTEVVPAVLDGELVADGDTRPRQHVVGRLIPRRVVAAAVQFRSTTTAARFDRGGRRALRAGWTAVQGAASWGRRGQGAVTHGVLREQVRLARAAGQTEQLAKWAEQLEKAKDARMKRLLDLPRAALGVATLAVLAVAVVWLLLLVGATVAQFTAGGTDWSGWWGGVGTALGVVGGVLHVLLVLVAPVLAVPTVVLLAWREGRRAATPPMWLLTADERALETVIVTPGGIADALAHLGIAPLNKAIKDGWQVEFVTPPVRVNNRGYHAVFGIPIGVTPEMIVDKRVPLARNLIRAPLEVWPTAAPRGRAVDLWVADQGATERAAAEYPLLHDGVVDVFVGVPLGESQRGDVIAPPLVGANMVFGGLMGQGKSNAARVTFAGAALDPIARLRVFVFAANGDFDSYRPRLERYARGVDDEIAEQAVEELRELYAEVGRREARLAELGAKKVTRALALQHPELFPIITLFSECHELFGHEEYGKEAADLAVQTIRRARKTGIVLAFDTQSSRADAIPPKIVELCKLNTCFAVKTWRSNDGFLGDGSFQAGIRATELRPGKDVGTSVLTGATVERFEIVKWFFIDVDDDTGFDAAEALIQRAMRKVHPAAIPRSRRAEPVRERDLLEDLDEVLGHEPLPIADVAPLLSALAPAWPPYRSLSGKALRERLAAHHGVKVPSTGNRWPLDPASVRQAIARRSPSDPDDETAASTPGGGARRGG